MPQRRSLKSAIATKAPVADGDAEQAFVAGITEKNAADVAAVVQSEARPTVHGEDVRMPLTTRLRPALIRELKRISFERTLEKKDCRTMQDIVEDALAKWLKHHKV